MKITQKPTSAALSWPRKLRAGQHEKYPGFMGGEQVAQVVACRKLEGVRVLPYPSGRPRKIYVAMADLGGGWGIVAACKSLTRAKREIALALGRAGM